MSQRKKELKGSGVTIVSYKGEEGHLLIHCVNLKAVKIFT